MSDRAGRPYYQPDATHLVGHRFEDRVMRIPPEWFTQKPPPPSTTAATWRALKHECERAFRDPQMPSQWRKAPGYNRGLGIAWALKEPPRMRGMWRILEPQFRVYEYAAGTIRFVVGPRDRAVEFTVDVSEAVDVAWWMVETAQRRVDGMPDTSAPFSCDERWPWDIGASNYVWSRRGSEMYERRRRK